MLRKMRREILLTTGEKIRRARIEKGWTQKQLGEFCKIAEPTIRRYELGKLKPKKETLEKIAAPLGIYYLDLYGDDEGAEILSYVKEGIRLGLNHQVSDAQHDYLKPFRDQGYEFTETERQAVSIFNRLNGNTQQKIITDLARLSLDSRYRKTERAEEPDEDKK